MKQWLVGKIDRLSKFKIFCRNTEKNVKYFGKIGIITGFNSEPLNFEPKLSNFSGKLHEFIYLNYSPKGGVFFKK